MSQDQAKPEPGTVDIQALLAEVEAAVEEKKARGIYDPDELRRVEQEALSYQAQPAGGDASAADEQAAAELRGYQQRLEELWDAKQWGVTTHRGGLAGRLITLLKKLIYRLSKFPASIWLARQVSFNDELVKLLRTLLPRHNDLRRRMAHNEKRLDSLEESARRQQARQAQGETRLDLLEELSRRQQADLEWLRGQLVRWQELRGEFREHQRVGEARLQALERETYKGRPQVEIMLARLQGIVEQAAREVTPQAGEEVSRARWQNRGDAYLAFEDIHRGEREAIKQRQSVYLPYFRECVSETAPLLDIGCGRGEFLEAAREAGLPGLGVDLNPDSVEVCRELGLQVSQGDALEYLRGLEDQSLGGVLMAQLIEHLTLDQLMELVSLAVAKLKPGGVLIAETVNPQCLTTFSGAFYLDLTHIKPIHPEAVRFLWRWAGLGDNQVIYLSPYPPQHRLELIDTAAWEPGADPELLDTAQALNRNLERLNQLLYGYQDYAVVGRK